MRRIGPALALAASLVAGAGSASAGGFLFVPPLRVDAAPVSMMTGGDAVTGWHVLVGAHWASLSPGWKTGFDLGVGYVRDRFGPEAGPPLAAYRLGEDKAVPEAADLEVQGFYLEVADRIAGSGRYHRGWLAARGEVLFGSVDGQLKAGGGLVGRASWEIFGGVAGGASNGGVVGVLGLGGFVELGLKWLPDGRPTFQSLAGVSARLPLIIAGN